MKYFKSLLFLLILSLTLILYSCGGGGGGSEETPSTTPTTSTASLTVLVDSTTTPTTRATTTTASQGKAILIVDTNNDGAFDENSGDEKYEGIIDSEGKVSFKDIAIPAGETVYAKLRVEKNGRAPYEKIVELSENASLTIDVTTTPVQKVTAPVNATVSLAKRGVPVYLVFSLKKDAAGARRIEVRTSTRRDVRADSSTELQAVIPGAIIPSGVDEISASMKRFSGVSDRNYFPGRFVGKGAPSQYVRRDGSDEYRLKSVAFSLIKLEDQNGKPIKFENRRDGNDTITVTINIPQNAYSQITEDADNSTDVVEVPIYRYDYATGNWEYIGLGNLTCDGIFINATALNSAGSLENLVNSNGYSYCDVRFDVPASDWSEYLNIDYPVWFGGEPVIKNVCLKFVNDNGTPLEYVDVWADGPTYFYDWSDEDGMVEFQIPVPSGVDASSYINGNYTFHYSYWSYGISDMPIGDLTFNSNYEGCDLGAQVVINNPFDSEIKVVVRDEDGQPVSGIWVDMWSEDYSFWNSGYTNEDGEVTFKARSNIPYVIDILGVEKHAEVNGALDSDEKSDNGKKVIVEFTKENQPPEVWVWVYPDPVKAGAIATAYVSAWDPEGSDLTLNATWNNQIISCSGSGNYGYGYWTCSLNTNNLSGDVTFQATVSDGEKVGSSSYTVNILAATNNPPVIYGLMIFENGTKPVMDWNNLKTGNYTFEAFGWDPDGDNITFTYEVNGTTAQNGAYTFTQAGEYTIKVIASDGNDNSTATYNVRVVGDNIPADIQLFYTDATNPGAGDEITVYAFVYDPDTKLQPNDFLITINGNNTIKSNETVEELYPGSGFYSYQADIQLPSNVPSDGKFDITLNVDNATSTFTIWVENPNTPPYFTVSLPESLSLNAGDTHTFNVEAVDDDGDQLTYTWYVKYGTGDYEEAGTGQSFTYTFENGGTYFVKVVVSDGKTEVSEACEVAVQSTAAEEGKLIIHTGITGIYVTVHNPSTLEPILTVQTDENGDAIIDNAASYGDSEGLLTVSLSFTPDIVMTKDQIFEMAVKDIAEKYYEENGTFYNAEDIIENGCIPVDDAQLLADNDTEAQQIASADTDSNGCIDKDELYQVALSILDKDGDGVLEFKDVENSTVVKVIMVKNLAPGEYDLTKYYKEEVMENDTPFKNVSITIKNMPAYWGIEIAGPWWYSYYLSNNNNVTSDVNGTINLWTLQEDGKYSLIFKDMANKKCYYLLDQDVDTLTVDYNDFINGKSIEVLNRNDYYGFNIEGYHKAYYDLGLGYQEEFLENGTIDYWYYCPAALDNIILNYSYSNSSFAEDALIHTWYENREVKSVDEVPDVIDFSNVDFLDIQISKTDTGFQLNGSDVSNDISFEMSYEYEAGNSDTDYHLSLEFTSYGKLSSEFVPPNWTEILPEAVVTYIKEIQSNATYQDEMLDISYYPNISSASEWAQAGATNLLNHIDCKEVEVYISYNTVKRSSTGTSKVKIIRTPFGTHILRLKTN